MSGLEIASGVVGFLEMSFRLLDRLLDAYEGQKELAQVLTSHRAELQNVNTAIKLVRDEDALQTATVTAELVEMEKIAKRLVELLRELSRSRSTSGQFIHQLIYRSRDEEKLKKIMQELSRSHEHLALRIHVAHVGLTKTLSEQMVVDAEVVQRIDKLLQEVFTKGRGLQMIEFLRSRNLQGDGIIPLTDADVAALPKEERGAKIFEGTRLIVGNLTKEQAIQINGPIGRDGWVEASHIEIRDNIAAGESTMINHAISMDTFLGAMILDAQSVALSIPLAAKETLAARWQVRVMAITQLFGLAGLPLLVANLFRGSFAADDCRCRCLTLFWWAWLSSCSPSRKEQALFWTYYGLRCAIFCQTSFHSLYNTKRFHEAEPKCGDEGTENQKKGGILLGITFPSNGSDGLTAFYGDYPAMASCMYALYGLLALTSMGAAEMTIRDLDLKPSSAINSIGQIVALVVAGATAIRAAWLLLLLFIRESRSGDAPGWMWPFQVYRFSSSPSYILLEGFRLAPDSIKLGSIIKDPSEPSSPLDDPVSLGSRAPAPHVRTNVEATVTHWPQETRQFDGGIPAFRRVTTKKTARMISDAIKFAFFGLTRISVFDMKSRINGIELVLAQLQQSWTNILRGLRNGAEGPTPRPLGRHA
ncbi:hypothetical protein ACJ41O_010808 [Fusarium nematophilum]